ncbi:MAG: chemotaxis response regulator protein-glutamate methylesterase [Tissierellaceae bacterium]|nr:chemotaxis response regulator protein-glutamate methylesterase [Tissierellaceae bacterium]
MKKIKVLVVDDSLVFREILARGISSDPDIEVVGKASDPFDARDKLIELEPDVMTCDINMPKMDGIQFVKRLLPQYPIPVIMVSGMDDAVFDAMEAGAVEFVVKPDMNSPKGVQEFIYDLIEKIKIASKSKIFTEIGEKTLEVKDKGHIDKSKIIAIGASTGGTDAITKILNGLPPNMPGIVIVQHIPPGFSNMFAKRLNNQTHFEVKEGEDRDTVEPGKVIIAPGDKHMKIKNIGGKYKIEVYSGERVSGHCPSVDVLFNSVAKEVKSKAIGVILTGMGYDGAKGLLAMKRNGARTIGQDEKSSVVFGMPRVAQEVGAVQIQGSIDEIPKIIHSMSK